MIAPQSSHTSRIDSLDALRGLAAVLVLFYHLITGPQAGELVRLTVILNLIDLGHLGVCLFFIISGYVIPLSLDRTPLPLFWWRRILRLFPTYWLSIGLILIISALGLAQPTAEQFQTTPVWSVLVNMTMLQPLFGGEYLIGVYWSLYYELLFYIAMSLLVLLTIHKQSMGIAVFVLAAIGLESFVLPRFNISLPVSFAYFGLMCIGHVLYRIKEQRVSALAGYVLVGAYMVLFTVLPMPLRALTARTIAVILFILLMRLAWKPGFMVQLGLISYPLYLLHELIIALIDTHIAPLDFVLRAGASIGVAWLVYRYFEVPIRRFGRQVQFKNFHPKIAKVDRL